MRCEVCDGTAGEKDIYHGHTAHPACAPPHWVKAKEKHQRWQQRVQAWARKQEARR